MQPSNLAKYLAIFAVAISINALTTSSAIAQNHYQLIDAFNGDPSAPTLNPTVSNPIADDNLMTPNTGPSPDSDYRWQTYDKPINQCIPGNIILPSNGSDVFSYLFSESTPMQVNMAIKGWEKGKCVVTLTVGADMAHYCAFKKDTLRELMDSILNNQNFDTGSQLATDLQTECQGTPFISS